MNRNKIYTFLFCVLLMKDYVTSFAINANKSVVNRPSRNINKHTSDDFEDICPGFKKTLDCSHVGGKVELTDAFYGISSEMPPSCVYNANANECIEKTSGFLPYLTLFKLDCNNQVSCDLFAAIVTLDTCGRKLAHYLHIDYYCKDITITTTRTTTLSTSLFTSTHDLSTDSHKTNEPTSTREETTFKAPLSSSITNEITQITEKSTSKLRTDFPDRITTNPSSLEHLTSIFKSSTTMSSTLSTDFSTIDKTTKEHFGESTFQTTEVETKTMVFSITDPGETKPTQPTEILTNRQTDSTQFQTKIIFTTTDQNTDVPIELTSTDIAIQTTKSSTTPISSSPSSSSLTKTTSTEELTTFTTKLNSTTTSLTSASTTTLFTTSSTMQSSTLTSNFNSTFIASTTSTTLSPIKDSTSTSTNTKITDFTTRTTIIGTSETKNPTLISEIEITTSSNPTEIPITVGSATSNNVQVQTQTTQITFSNNITLPEQSTKTQPNAQSTTSLAYSTETQETQTSEPDTSNNSTLTILLAVLVPTAVFTLSIGVYLLYKFKYFKKFTSVKPEIPKTESIPLN